MVTIKDKWQWNKIIEGRPEFDLYADIHFLSNNESFERLRITGYAIPPHVDIYYGNKQVTTHYMNDLNDENNDGDFEVTCEFNEAYRIMDFGETEQYIDDEIYNFIVANATEYYTVAYKALKIAKNAPEVYKAGKAEGRTEGYEAGYNKGYIEGLDTDAYEKGKQAERDAFWKAFQTPSRRRWDSAFQYACWNDDTFYPKYGLIPTGSAASLFRYCDISDLEGRLNECGVILDTSGATNLNCAFGECIKITAIPTLDLTKCTASGATSGLFGGCVLLKTIRKIIVSEATVFSNSFQNCPMLENIAFEGDIGSDIDFNSSTKLTEASIRSIVNALTPTPLVMGVGKTLTLSKTAVDVAFKGNWVWDNDLGTAVWDDTVPGSESYDWQALIGSKVDAGWIITLV